MMKDLKIEKIVDKDKIEVLSQSNINCSTKDNPKGYIMGCDRDCSTPTERPAYKSDKY